MIEPLPQDLEEVLAPERAIEPADDAVRSRIEARLAASLGAPITAVEPPGTSATPQPLGEAVETAPRPPGLPGWLWKVGLATLAVLGAALVVGSLDGRDAEVDAPAADVAARADAASETGTPDEAAAHSAPTGASSAAALAAGAASFIELDDLPDAEPIRSSATWAARASASVATATDEALRRERALTDAARTAIGLGDGAGALDKLSAAREQFPAGRLVQEREALTVQALWISGQHQQAEERARSFRQRFPSSPLLHSIETLLGPHPAAQP